MVYTFYFCWPINVQYVRKMADLKIKKKKREFVINILNLIDII